MQKTKKTSATGSIRRYGIASSLMVVTSAVLALSGGLGIGQTLKQVDIAPPAMDPAPGQGSYVKGAGDAFTITGWGIGMYPDIANSGQDLTTSGDVMTFAYEEVTGDFDRRVKITSMTSDPADPVDAWTHGGLMARIGNTNYSSSLQLLAGNPKGANNSVRFIGRALDGSRYTEFSRIYSGVDKVLPNQWLRLRRVGDYFAAYLGTNGMDWTLIGERYQEWPAKVLVGAYAAGGAVGTQGTVAFASYGTTPLNDTIAPRLVSAGTIDKKLVGVKFSEMVDSSTALNIANYKLSEGTITGIKSGIGGDAVYLEVSGLTNDTFNVTVLGGIKDTAGNLIAANSVAQARSLNWVSQDVGRIQNPNNRPTPGDDPYRVGRAVMVSSDENPEVEIVGGGSNQWNAGDYIHFIYRTDPLVGDFDVTIAVSRFDRSVNQGGYSNSGLMLRASPYLAGKEYTTDGTKVPMVANVTYIENSAPGRGAIPLWRNDAGGGYGNGNAGFNWATLIGGKKGYYAGLRAMNASGAVDPQSSSTSARYLRVKRTGSTFFFYASWDGVDWAQVDKADLPAQPNSLLLGFSTMTDSGAFDPPFSAYGNNGHQIDPNDPLNPFNPAIDPPAPGGRSYMNESVYAAQRIKIFPHGVTTPLPVSLAVADIAAEDGSSAALPGSWVSKGTYAFDMTGGGTAVFRNAGDEMTFAYEEVTGDFDKQVRITSLTSALFNPDGSAYTPAEGETAPVDVWARAGLMVRSSTNNYSASLKILAANPAGANVVEVRGRGIDGQNYTIFSRSYAGVTNALPNQWLRMQRVGNYFAFYVSKEGVDWALIGQRYQEMPAKVLLGSYAAAALNPDDATGNPNALKAKTSASFADYKKVDLGDLVPPTLVSVGTLDKKTVGVKFSELVSSATATNAANYKLSQGTVSSVRLGIGGDAAYLTVTGLTADTFTVTVNGVKDTAGNAVAANSVASGKVSAWTSKDIGYIQNPDKRPTPGDDPYRVGQAVALSSDDNPEVDILGGGSNAWNSGDFLHYLYQQTPLVGDFDVVAKVSRYDRSANQGGYSNSGLMLRADLYNSGEEYTANGTKVPMVANVTYLENSSPGRGAIPLWRNEAGGGYGNGAAGYSWATLVDGLKGYYGNLRSTDSVGTRDPQSSATTARWLRIKRVGSAFKFYSSWDGSTWDNYDNADLPALPSSLLLGFSTMTDSGASTPPNSAYGGNGHSIDPTDPLNPAVVGGNVMNDANYAAQRVRLYPKGPVSGPLGPLSIQLSGGKASVTWTGVGTLESAPAVTGPWTTVSGAASPYSVTPGGSQTYYRLKQ